jgi:hypothetical protein
MRDVRGLWPGCGPNRAPALRPGRSAGQQIPVDLGFWIGAGEGNRTLMTSLEGVPRMAVVGADLHVRLAGSSRGLPLVTPVNGTVIKASPLAGAGMPGLRWQTDPDRREGQPPRTGSGAAGRTYPSWRESCERDGRCYCCQLHRR